MIALAFATTVSGWLTPASAPPPTRCSPLPLCGRKSISLSSRSTLICAGTALLSCEEFLAATYDAIDYEAVLFPETDAQAYNDDTIDAHDEDGAALARPMDSLDDDDDAYGGDEFIYGESDLSFFLQCLQTALALVSPVAGSRRSFCDLGGGKGSLALAAAREEPVRLGGACTSLELMPELHAIGAAAYAIASASDPALARAIAVRGSIYDLATLQTTCAGAAVVYAYATKFESSDGVHVERLSAALAASALPADTVVVTVNRRLRAADGWVEAAPPLAGAVPHETAEQGTAFFWRQSRHDKRGGAADQDIMRDALRAT